MYLNQESVNVPYMELLSNNCQVSSSTRRRDDDLLELIPSNSSLNLQSDFVHLQITSDTSQNFQSQALSLTLGNQMQPSFDIQFNAYLRPAQELLDEVVSVWKALKHSSKKSNSILDETLNLPTNDREKMSKLLTMLEELNGRYRLYHHQMQVLGSWFEGIAGFGSAKPYTTLALQTISRQFIIQRSIGEEQEEEATSQGRLTRLRDIELQIRQQKAAHQFGTMRHSWRPQRGLPETSVSILRAWLFEHFLHPYPKDSEKIMLARQTGLTRGQVANWFINARVRLWKPMVEEMYTEEFREDSKTNLHENVDTEYLNVTDYGVTKQQNHYNHLIADNERLNNASPFDVSGNTYDLGELGDLMVENRVSLALGLQHSEIGGSNNLPASPSSSSGIRMPLEITDYIEDHHDSLIQQNRIIGISTQMLPDFT